MSVLKKGTGVLSSQVDVLVTAGPLIAGRNSRNAITFENMDGLNPIYIGPVTAHVTGGFTVSATNGFRIPAGSSATFESSAGAAWQAIAATGTVRVGILEELDLPQILEA